MTLLSAGVVTLTLTGCSRGPLVVEPPVPPADVAAECVDLTAALPDVVNGQPEAEVVPASDFTRAWGDPEIVLACGVERPRALLADAALFEIDGVTWFAEELSRGTRFTTVDRRAYVQVDVPLDYRPEAEALIDLAPALSENIPTVPSDG